MTPSLEMSQFSTQATSTKTTSSKPSGSVSSGSRSLLCHRLSTEQLVHGGAKVVWHGPNGTPGMLCFGDHRLNSDFSLYSGFSPTLRQLKIDGCPKSTTEPSHGLSQSPGSLCFGSSLPSLSVDFRLVVISVLTWVTVSATGFGWLDSRLSPGSLLKELSSSTSGISNHGGTMKIEMSPRPGHTNWVISSITEWCLHTSFTRSNRNKFLLLS